MLKFERLNLALRLILDGAEIMALERDRYWREPHGLVLSAGPFVAALEYATGKKAELMGKPSPQFLQLDLSDLKVGPRDVAMIGDRHPDRCARSPGDGHAWDPGQDGKVSGR
ncbi:MAG: hypothetical protein WAW52_01060 [Methanothrix sp.]